MTTPHDIAKAITDTVQVAIDASDLTMNKVATLSGIPRSTLRRKLVDSSFTVTELVFLARALNLADDAFVGSPTQRHEVA